MHINLLLTKIIIIINKYNFWKIMWQCDENCKKTENSALPSQTETTFENVKIEKFDILKMSLYYCFCHITDHINAAFVSIFQQH